MSSEDQVSSLPASSAVSRRPPIRGHRPSIMGSMDLADESRDTVEMKDSEDWYPQFSPAASLGPVGKLQESQQSGLSALLAQRMNKTTFESRFLGGQDLVTTSLSLSRPIKLQQAEASAESLFNRSAKLGALLANRPDRQRLENLNIMKAPQGKGSSALASMQAKLDASKKKDKLNNLLSARPNQQSLLKKGVLHDETKQSEPRERLASAKNVLGDFMLSRPNPEQLIKQKIITDIGDLPGGLERKQENQLVPQLVGGALENKNVVAVSLGFSHSVALDSEGVVYVFGSGANGRLGLQEGSFADVAVPTVVPAAHFGGEKVASIDAGENHTAIITASGKLFTFGTGGWGRLGLGDQNDQTIPKQVNLPEGETAAAVSCGAYHSLVLSTSNKLYAFGWNKNGRCGLGRKHPSLLVLTPAEIPFFTPAERKVVAFEAGQGYSFALLESGETYVWGTGSFGGLGLGDETDVWEPKELTISPLSQVAFGATHSLALTKSGDLLSWGCNDKGQLGRHDDSASSSSASSSSTSPKNSSSNYFTPGKVTLGSISASANGRCVAAGKSHSFFVAADGSLHAWGLGSRGILGSGTETDSSVPAAVAGISKVLKADASWTHSAALVEGGKLYTWGAKNNGRLGF